MVGALHVHDLILLRAESAILSPEGESMCPNLTPNQLPWVVVRRGRVSGGLIPVGVRGSERSERYAGFAPLNEVIEVRRPDQLRLLFAENSRKELQAFQSLSYLESRLAGLDMAWGPGGSVGYELASGIPAVRNRSDLDLIFFAPEKLDGT